MKIERGVEGIVRWRQKWFALRHRHMNMFEHVVEVEACHHPPTVFSIMTLYSGEKRLIQEELASAAGGNHGVFQLSASFSA